MLIDFFEQIYKSMFYYTLKCYLSPMITNTIEISHSYGEKFSRTLFILNKQLIYFILPCSVDTFFKNLIDFSIKVFIQNSFLFSLIQKLQILVEAFFLEVVSINIRIKRVSTSIYAHLSIYESEISL